MSDAVDRVIDATDLSPEEQLEQATEVTRAFAAVLRPLFWTQVFQFTCVEGAQGHWMSNQPDYQPAGGIAQGTTFRGVFAASPAGSITQVTAGWGTTVRNQPVSQPQPMLTLFWNPPPAGAYDFVFAPPPLPNGAINWTRLLFSIDGVHGTLQSPITLTLFRQ